MYKQDLAMNRLLCGKKFSVQQAVFRYMYDVGIKWYFARQISISDSREA